MVDVVRLAMWSGPRNVSTALMRAWGNRTDTFVTDEPLYAHYLKVTKLPHPGASEVVRVHESDWGKVVEWLAGPVPEGKRVWYQKHMAHHLLPQVGTDWLDRVTHGFLLRDPGEMITSLMQFIPRPVITDTGLPQQVAIFERVRERMGKAPAVVDAKDLLMNPRGVLIKLCDAVGVEFQARMLKWPAGLRETDGVWAKHWYEKVAMTTEFAPYTAKGRPVPAELAALVEECRPLYRKLHEHRIVA